MSGWPFSSVVYIFKTGRAARRGTVSPSRQKEVNEGDETWETWAARQVGLLATRSLKKARGGESSPPHQQKLKKSNKATNLCFVLFRFFGWFRCALCYLLIQPKKIVGFLLIYLMHFVIIHLILLKEWLSYSLLLLLSLIWFSHRIFFFLVKTKYDQKKWA